MNFLKVSYDGIPLGLGVRGTIAKLFSYRIRRGLQEKYAYVCPDDPKTEAQLARRALFAAGVATWKAFSAEEKNSWDKGGPRSSINWFLRDYLRTY